MPGPYRRSPVLALALVLAAPGLAPAASKALVASVGDAAPGGGVFAGPAFSDWPTAAGAGWIAFRGEIIGGTTGETLVVARMTTPPTRIPVASLGEITPAGDGFRDCAGKFKGFVGHPAVNANGDVAFTALIQTVVSEETAAPGPTHAGIFAMRGGVLTPVACARQTTPGGTFDLVGAIGGVTAADTDATAERSPSINDAGDVAFLTAYANPDGTPAGGAVVLAPHAGGFLEIARIDGVFDTGKITDLGPPALNNHGVVAFHATATTTDPSDSDGVVDGIFRGDGQTLDVMVRDGIAPMPLDQPLVQFEDPVSLNDQGDVAFLAGPLVDPTNDSSNAETTPGVFVCRAGVVTALAYPSETIEGHVVTGVALGPFGGSALPAPSLAPDGSVAFFVSLNDGNAEAIAGWDGVTVRALLYTAGKTAAAAPPGGVYAGAESAPALDATGGIVFRARVVGGPSGEAVVYVNPDGTATSIDLGEAAPRDNGGFFGGRAFSAPRITDAEDVVFRAYMVRGPSSVGIFRARGGRVEAIVRAGDPSPSGALFLDIVGQPAVNQHGAIVFSAQVEDQGRGIFIADARGIRKIAARGDAAPGRAGTTFTAFGPNAQINDAGTVAFRATTGFTDPATDTTIRREGIFLRDDSGTDPLVYADGLSPAGLPFLKLRDPLLTALPSVVFRAPLGVLVEQSSGIFTADGHHMAGVALQQQPLTTGIVLSGFSGTPVVTPTGEVAFLATRAMPGADPSAPPRSLGAAILAGNGQGLELVVARDMPAPGGGTFKTLGQPAINAAGTIAFRGAVQSAFTRTSGLFVRFPTGLVPFLLRGEATPVGGRFDTFAAQVATNNLDDLAFDASVSGGQANNALFVASPTVLRARPVVLRLTNGRGHDTVALRATLQPGRVSDGVDPANEPVTLTLRDADGVLWTATLAPKRLTARGRSFILHVAKHDRATTPVRALRVDVLGRGGVRFTATSKNVDLTQGGTRTLTPPFTISCEVGDDSGMATVVPRVIRVGRRR